MKTEPVRKNIEKKYVFFDRCTITHIHALTTRTHAHTCPLDIDIHTHTHVPWHHSKTVPQARSHILNASLYQAQTKEALKITKHVRHRVFLFFDHIEQTWMCDCRSVIRWSILGPHKLGTPSRNVSSDAFALFSYCGTSQRDQRRRRSGARERHKWWEEVPQSSLILRSYETLTSTHL